jgi:translation initiation factor IF-2
MERLARERAEIEARERAEAERRSAEAAARAAAEAAAEAAAAEANKKVKAEPKSEPKVEEAPKPVEAPKPAVRVVKAADTAAENAAKAVELDRRRARARNHHRADLAHKMSVKATEVIKTLMKMGRWSPSTRCWTRKPR